MRRRRQPYYQWEEEELRELTDRVGLGWRDRIRSNRFIVLAAAKPGGGGGGGSAADRPF